MKKIILFIFLIYWGIQINSQEIDPDFYQTWYLSDFLPGDHYNEAIWVNEVTPEINPFITFNEDFTLEGFGSCNSFTGSFEMNNAGLTEILVSDFSSSESECESESQNFCEDAFFSMVDSSTMYFGEISEVEGGLKLELETTIFGYATFYNFPLSVEDVNKEKVDLIISPNPTNDVLNIKTSIAIKEVHIYDSNGTKVKRIIENFDSIDVEELEKGVYILFIITEEGTENKKFIKTD